MTERPSHLFHSMLQGGGVSVPVENVPASRNADTSAGALPSRFSKTRAEQVLALRRRLALGAAGLAMVVGPGLFGSVMPGPLMVLGMVLAAGLFIIPSSRAAPALSLSIWLVVAAFVTVFGVAFAQIVQFHLAGGASSPYVPGSFPVPTTVNVGATEKAAGPILMCLLAFLLGVQLASTPERAWRLIWAVAVIAMMWTCLTLALFVLEPRMLLWVPKRAYLDSLTGPFVNRNTAAVYFGLGLLCFIACFRQQVRDLIRQPMLARNGPARSPSSVLAVAGGLMIMVVAIMLTRSRAGILLALLSSSALVATLCFRSECLSFKARRPALFRVLALLILLGVALSLVSLIDTVAQRGVGDGGRVSVYLACLQMMARQPVWGNGLGTFADVFPTIRPLELSSWGVWDRAHNTLLELAVDVGVPAAALTLIAAVQSFWTLVKGMVTRRRNYALPSLGACAAFMVGSHSLVDFSLQIPGLAAMFFLLFGACLAQAKPDYEGQPVSSRNADQQGIAVPVSVSP